jgi:hypothetical protein
VSLCVTEVKFTAVGSGCGDMISGRSRKYAVSPVSTEFTTVCV